MRTFLAAFALFTTYTSFAACTYCTDINEALTNPGEVEHLDLSGKGVTALPDSLHLFVNLKSLDLSDNRIESLNFGKAELPYLKSINLNFNPGIDMINISGIDKAFPVLSELHLRDCSIFLISAELGKLKELSFLDLTNNKLKTIPDALDNCNLSELKLRNNDLNNAYWLTNLWSVSVLDISDNEKLRLDEVGHALLFKDLDEVVVSPRSNNQLEKIFNKLNVHTLKIRGGQTALLAKSLPSNNNLKRLVFESVLIENGQRFYSWCNDFSGLEQIDFVNMEMPAGLSSIKSARQITLDLCSVERSSDINTFNENVKVRVVNMRGSFIGTSQNNTINEAPVAISETMINNKVPEIVAPETFKKTVNAQKEQIVVLQNSAYAIPKNAFLTESGEVYKGDVSLEIKEFNDPFINALSGAPMVYRENGTNQLFSSSGMIDFRAYDDEGNELEPNPESVIEVELVDLQPSEDSRLYVFNEEDSNWVDIGAPTPTGDADLRQEILDSLNKIPDDYFYQVNPVKPDFTMDVDRSRYNPYEFTFDLARDGFIPSRFSKIDLSNKDYRKTYGDQEWLTEKRRVFVVDTIMTDELKDMFKELKKEGRMRARFYRKNEEYGRELPIPGTIRDLKLEPNFEKDNFELTFKYRNENVRIPVIFKEKGSIERIQRKEKLRFIDFDREKGRAAKSQKVLDRKIDDAVVEGAQRLREARADYLSDPRVLAWEEDRKRMELLMEVRNQETNRFGLTQFGMVNCDYFSRNAVDGYYKSTAVALDQDGEPVNVPDEIRTVIPEDNVYVYNKSDQVPQLKRKKAISFFAIGLTKIAIIIGWELAEGGLSRPIIRTHNTDGKSPEDIKKLLQKY